MRRTRTSFKTQPATRHALGSQSSHCWQRRFETGSTQFITGLALACILLPLLGLRAAENDGRRFDRKTTWNGYEQLHFKVAGRAAYVVTPQTAAPGKPWVWRARFPGYHAEMDIALVGRGFHIAYVDVGGMFGSPAAIDIGDEFYRYLTTNLGLAKKPALEGVSRGGLFVYNWAVKNADKVACIYCDTPVCDFKSWPGGQGNGLGSEDAWGQCLKAYGLSEGEALKYDQNPIDTSAPIAKAKIPILHIVSENDRVVPPRENTYLLKQRLERHGHTLEVISVPEGTIKSNGHHFDHPEPDRVANFISKHARSTDRPNIVIILADDFGVGDIQAHFPDNKIPTPHLDDFVRQGMSITDAHSPSAVCSPTRYGLLTGRYCWRTRLQEWVVAAYEPPLISEGRSTLARFLKQNGYHTACIGKWHLGWQWAGPQPSRMTEVRNGQKTLTWDFTKAIRGGPTERGFDHYFGVDLPNLPPFTYIANDRVVIQPTAKYKLDSAEGVVLPRGFVGAPMAPNWRMQEILPEITRRAVRYVHDQAKQNEPFFLYFSMTSPHEPIVPSKNFRGKSGIAPIADFVMETDWSAGQVINAIDDAGISKDTIVIFTADNGHSHYTGWEKLVEAGHMPSGPYRGHKGDIWEGGHRVPLIVRWPKHIQAGTSSHQMVSLTDIFATSADIIGVELPADGAEDSLSFLPVLLGKPNEQRRTTLVNHSNHGEFAYREGPWKLVFRMSGRNLQQSRGREAIAELYNLESDISEQKNLSKVRPDLVQQMTGALEDLIERGTSRVTQEVANDTVIRFDTIQTKRWAPALE